MSDEATAVFGVDIDKLRACEIMTRLEDKLLEPERWLMTTKWFDYRFLDPVQATYLFAHHYREVYRRKYADHIDTQRAPYVNGLKAQDPFEGQGKNPEGVGLWKARQMADGLTMPYDLFVDIAMEWKLRRSKRKYLPRPLHLYEYDLMTAVNETWNDRRMSKIYVAMDERFLNENYRETAIQDAHHEWLIESLRTRASISHLLHQLVSVDRVLPSEKALKAFGGQVLSQAIAA